MTSRVKTWLLDILQSINEIEGYFSNQPRDFKSYQTDIKTKRAVERNLEIIGEAMKRVRSHSPDLVIHHSEKIVATRNHIIHGYDKVSDEMIWSILINHLPKLRREIDELIRNNNF